MITDNKSIGLNKRRIQNETIREIAYSCSEYSMFEKYLMRLNKNLPISETRKAEKRIPEETQVTFLQLRLDSRLLPCSLYCKSEIRKMEKEEKYFEKSYIHTPII